MEWNGMESYGMVWYGMVCIQKRKLPESVEDEDRCGKNGSLPDRPPSDGPPSSGSIGRDAFASMWMAWSEEEEEIRVEAAKPADFRLSRDRVAQYIVWWDG